MSKVKELLRTAASSLSTQQKEYNTLQANRAAYTDELQKTQLDALREAARLRRGN
jgi:cell division protein FtsB